MKEARENEQRIASQCRQEMERTRAETRCLEGETRMARQRAEEEHRPQKVLLNKRLAEEAAKAEAARAARQREIGCLQPHQVEHHLDPGGGCIVI